MFTCNYCGREFKSSQAVKRHAGYCKARTAFDQAVDEIPGLGGRSYPYRAGTYTYFLCPQCGGELYMGTDIAGIRGVTPCPNCHVLVNDSGEISPRNIFGGLRPLDPNRIFRNTLSRHAWRFDPDTGERIMVPYDRE